MLATADLADVLGDEAHVCEPKLQNYGGIERFHGPILTLWTFVDNSKLRETLETPGEGRVLVVDGNGSVHCALLGSNLATLAAKNGWAGVVINGCIRDALEVAKIQVGVRAIGTHPKASRKRGMGDLNVALSFAGVTFLPGHYLVADRDGIVVCEKLPEQARD